MPAPPSNQPLLEQDLRTTLLLGFVSGMACSGLELLGRAYRVVIDGRAQALTRQGLWTIPVVLVVLALALFLMIWTAGAVWRPLRRWSTLVGLAVGWALLSPLLVFGDRFHWASAALLATGIGIQARRLASRRSPAPQRLARVAAPLVTAAVLLGAGGAWLKERIERITPRAPDATLPAGAPNVLLLILDTVRASSLSLYGYPLSTTPHLEELARHGVTFDWAISPAPWTLPSHASMFTGRWPSELTADWLSPLEQEEVTLAEVLAARGYRTGGFTANVLATGVKSGLAQGFGHYEAIPLKLGVLLQSTAIGYRLFNSFVVWRLDGQRVGRKSASMVRSAFLDWIGDRPGDQPFFAFLNFFDAHRPYDPGPGFLGRFGPVTENSERLVGALNTEGSRLSLDSAFVAERRWRYAEAIATIDEEIGAIVAGLESRGLLENTIIVVTSDHGELIGEHGLFGHGHSLYLEETHVPLLIVAPHRVPAVGRVDQPVSLRHVAPTITDLIHIEVTELGGSSLRPLWEGDATAVPLPALSMVSGVPDHHSKAPIAKGNMAALVSGSWHYILNGDSTIELYQYRDDPAETSPLQRQAAIDTLRRLESALWSVWDGRASLAPELSEGATIASGPALDTWGRGLPDPLRDVVVGLAQHPAPMLPQGRPVP